MICPLCGNVIGDREKFCTNCGWKVEQEAQPKAVESVVVNQPEVSAQPVTASQQSYATQASYAGHSANNGQPVYSSQPTAPAQPAEKTAKVASTASFFFLDILFRIPVIGFIMAIIFSFDITGNVNIANYARANLIRIIIGAVLLVLFAILMVTTSEVFIEGIEELLEELYGMQI